MDAVKYFKTKNRICAFYDPNCSDCPLSSANNGVNKGCYSFSTQEPKRCIEIMEKWAAENPQKTILRDFLEKYPDAPMKPYGIPMDICPSDLGCSRHELCTYETEICTKCWSRPLEEAKNESLD